jgi:hypothetical protein
LNPKALKPEGPVPCEPVPGALRKRLSSVLEDRFGILGLDVRLRTDSPRLRDFFQHAYRWFPPTPSASRLDLAALLHGAPGVRALAAAGEEVIDLQRSPSPENQAFVYLLGALMDRIDGSVLVHGAAVCFESRGIILAGPAFAGKSTLVVELMKRGHHFLSDDAAPLHRSSGALLPFPRAVGIRKGPDGGSPPGFDPAGEGVLALPHRWLVDPAALGARLPAKPCTPAFLFYLDPAGWSAGRTEREVTYEIALAEEGEALQAELKEMGVVSVRRIQERPFPTLAARFVRTEHAVSDLVSLQRRHRNSIIYVEEIRPAVPRPAGPPVLQEVPVSALLLDLVRDVLNRGEGSRLMEAHGGRVGSLVFELGSLLGAVRCHRVSSGSPGAVAETITGIVSGDSRPGDPGP